jgi:hypothetical protein
MSTTLTVHDETTSGKKTHTLTLNCQTEHLTVRELIRSRICQEVQDFNQREPEYFRGLVAPADGERTELGYRLRHRRKIDWEEQYRRAVQAFEQKGFMVLVGDHIAQSLDQEVPVGPETVVSFVKTSPLVGG